MSPSDTDDHQDPDEIDPLMTGEFPDLNDLFDQMFNTVSGAMGQVTSRLSVRELEDELRRARNELTQLRGEVNRMRDELRTGYPRYAVLVHSRWLETEEPQATVMYTTDGWRWHNMCTCDPDHAFEIAEALESQHRS